MIGNSKSVQYKVENVQQYVHIMCRTVGNQFVVEIIAAQKTSFARRLQTNTNEKGNFILFKYLLGTYLTNPP